MSAPPPAKRPMTVVLFWVYCAMTIMVALLAIFGGVMVMAYGEQFNPSEEVETWYVLGGLAAAFGIVGIVLHLIPAFCPRSRAGWSIIQGLLIAYVVFWSVGCLLVLA